MLVVENRAEKLVRKECGLREGFFPFSFFKVRSIMCLCPDRNNLLEKEMLKQERRETNIRSGVLEKGPGVQVEAWP